MAAGDDLSVKQTDWPVQSLWWVMPSSF